MAFDFPTTENNFATALAVDHPEGGLRLTLPPGVASRLDPPSIAKPLIVTVARQDAMVRGLIADPSFSAIYRVEAIDGDDLVIAAAVEDTDDQTFYKGDYVALNSTSGIFQQIYDAINSLAAGVGGAVKIGNPVVDGGAGRLLYTDGAGKLADHAGLIWNAAANKLQVTAANAQNDNLVEVRNALGAPITYVAKTGAVVHDMRQAPANSFIRYTIIPEEANYPVAFNFVVDTSAQSDGRGNSVFSLGWNVGGGGARVVLSEPTFRIGFENHYQVATGQYWMEGHLFAVIRPDTGDEIRPFTLLVDKTGGWDVRTTFQGSQWIWADLHQINQIAALKHYLDDGSVAWTVLGNNASDVNGYALQLNSAGAASQDALTLGRKASTATTFTVVSAGLGVVNLTNTVGATTYAASIFNNANLHIVGPVGTDVHLRTGGNFVVANQGDSQQYVVVGPAVVETAARLYVNGAVAVEAGGTDGTLAPLMYFKATGFPTAQTHRIRGSLSSTATASLLSFETNTGAVGGYNANQLVLTGQGRVGLNETAPGAMLQITIASASTKGLLVKQAVSQSANYVELQNSGGSPDLVVDKFGRLGLGTGFPAAPLEVHLGTNINFRVRNTSGKPEIYAAFDADSPYGPLLIGGSTVAINSAGGGNVGIGLGADTPGASLQVNASTAATKGLIVRGFTTQTANLVEVQDVTTANLVAVAAAGNVTIRANAGYAITLADTSVSKVAILRLQATATDWAIRAQGNSADQLWIRNETGGVNALTIETSGIVGFGGGSDGPQLAVRAKDAITVPLRLLGAATLTRTVSNVALTSNVATITVTVAHSFVVGATVVLSGLATTALNGTYTVASAPTTTTFTFAKVAANIASTADSGTAVVSHAVNLLQIGSGASSFDSVGRLTLPSNQYNALQIPGGGSFAAAKDAAYIAAWAADAVLLALQAFTGGGQTANLTEWRNSGGAALTMVRADGSVGFPTLADSAAANNSLYYSSTQSKFVFKDPAGVANALY